MIIFTYYIIPSKITKISMLPMNQVVYYAVILLQNDYEVEEEDPHKILLSVILIQE